MEVLMTPSADVQHAVASCLPAIMPGLASDSSYVEVLIHRLLARLIDPDSTYGDRYMLTALPTVWKKNT